MGKAFRNPEKLQVVAIEVETSGFAKVRGVGAKIDSYIPDVAREDSNQLPLRLSNLIVETAKDAAPGEGLIVLHKSIGQTSSGKLFCIEYFREPTSLVAILWGAHSFDVTKAGVQNLHGSF